MTEAVFSQGEISLPVIMYHQICENPKIHGDYVIPLSLLRSDFEYMKENDIHPVSFAEVELFLSGKGRLPRNPVIITFDDGERSFLTKVVPLLEEYSYKANINIIGSLAKLYTENGDTDDRYAYLNCDDIALLRENPLVEVGCHSYNLHSLSTRRGMGKMYGESEKAYTRLIREDFRLFHKLFPEIKEDKPQILAYPYGIYNDTLSHLAEDEGYTVTLTCREFVNTLKKGEPLTELGRFNRPFSLTTEDFFRQIFP